MPTMTSSTSAPTPSQIAAIALTKLSLVARKALAAYLIVSADAGSVMTTCGPIASYKRGDRDTGGAVFTADDDPIGFQEIVDCRTLAQRTRDC